MDDAEMTLSGSAFQIIVMATRKQLALCKCYNMYKDIRVML